MGFAMMEREIVDSRIRLMIKYIDRLKGFDSVQLTDYLDNFDYQLMVERLIELLVEASSDINSYMLAQLHNVIPSTYYDSFIEAGKNHLITRELANELAKSAGMRNRLVHQYEEIDHEIVFKSISVALKQFPLYIQQIITYLHLQEQENG